MRSFIRTTLVGGFIFLIPLVVVVAVLGKAFRVMKVFAAPVDDLIPIETVAGFALVEFLTIIIMLLCCILAGLVARSAMARKAYASLDAVLLQLIPGYAWIKGITGDISEEEAQRVMKSVLVQFDDQYQLALEVDRTDEGLVAVYLPGVPDPRSGALSFVPADRVKDLDASFQEITRACRRLGRGSAAIVAG